MTELTCLAVDDEPLALGMVCAHIEKTPFLRLVGRYASALDALRALQEQPVDVLFLDIEMPELNGMELARALDRNAAGHPIPRIVFTTAFTQFALESYQVDALDYLLKPFIYEDFLRVALKAKAYFERIRTPTVPAPEPLADSFILKVEYQFVRVRYADILYIEGLKDYIKLHRHGEPKPLLSLNSLRALEDKLPAQHFLRIHRSYIVNLDRIDAVTRNSVQIAGTSVPVSTQYKDVFGEFLKSWL